MSEKGSKKDEHRGGLMDRPPMGRTVSNGSKGNEGDAVVFETGDNLQRRLGNRQIQLIAIGGSVGTAVFVSVSSGLYEGGAASLLLAFILGTVMMGLINNCMAEMVIYMPVSGAFVRMAGHWVDEAFGFFAGWNFFLYEAFLVPFEISALTLVLGYWRDDIPAVAVTLVAIAIYAALNVLAVGIYGEAEFWLSIGKVILFLIVFSFTLVTMCGGNPQHHAYGFSNWSHPQPFKEYLSTGSMGQFEGFLAALWIAHFAICGPEYLSMVAGEAKNPRVYLKTAYKATYFRFGVFFLGTALCVGIVVAANDPTLERIYGKDSTGSESGTAAASPYVMAMANLGIEGLPHVVNALLVTSIFSAGNSYIYNGSRCLYSLALAGRAPHFLTKCTKAGVPVYCLAVTVAFSFLALLQVSSSTSDVLTWFVNILSSAQVINFIIIAATYIRFYKATQVQGFDRSTLPYRGWFQPYSAWISLVYFILIVTVRGYAVFKPGAWDVGIFFTNYTMVLAAPCFYFSWKLIKRTKIVKARDLDLVWEKPVIDAYEVTIEEEDLGFWGEIFDMLRLHKLARRRQSHKTRQRQNATEVSHEVA